MCVTVCVFLVCVVCLSLPPRASGMGGGARGACSVDSRGRGQASWGATLALPLPPFAEQLALGFNPSPAAAVGGGCRYARPTTHDHDPRPTTQHPQPTTHDPRPTTDKV